MSKVVLVVLNSPQQAEGLLDAGARLLHIGGGGRLAALAVRLPPLATILPSEEVLTANREAALRAGQERWAAQLKAVVNAWAARVPEPGIRIDWLDVEGGGAAIVTEHGRRADAIVIARPGEHETEQARECLHAALFATGCPVLVVPPLFSGRLGHVVAIAWKDNPCAVKAVLASAPILSRAERVHVLCADGPAVMPAVLAEHEVAAALHAVPDGLGSTGERLLAAVHGTGADLLVMGAFARAPWRELLFGGVTRTMLATADISLLMMH